jgi:hypothetical protein
VSLGGLRCEVAQGDGCDEGRPHALEVRAERLRLVHKLAARSEAQLEAGADTIVNCGGVQEAGCASRGGDCGLEGKGKLGSACVCWIHHQKNPQLFQCSVS